VCSDEQGWNENPLVYCDGQGCTVAVHQACYGIVTVPTGPWFCRKCESQERAARVRCELCPSKDGALKRTDNNGWAHVVCALYIPEVRFGNVATMEPIILALVPTERYNKICYLCEQSGKESKAASGACMQCNKSGCKEAFHVTCAQANGLLCEEAGNYMDNVKYCGYCQYHYQRINKKIVKTIPAFRPVPSEELSPNSSPEKIPHSNHIVKDSSKHIQPTSSSSSSSSSSKSKGKRGRKPGSMLYDAKLEPPKFNPDLSSLNSSNNCIVSSGSSVTLTPVSSFSSSSEKSFSNNESSKTDRFFNSDHKSKEEKKTPNVVVKIGKHGETYHAKKDESEKDSTKDFIKEKEISAEASIEKVFNVSKSDQTENEKRLCLDIKEEVGEKKGFTNANFTESYVTQSVSVTASLIKSDKVVSSPPRKLPSDTTKIKVESMDVDSTVSVSSTISSSVSVSKPRPSSKDSSTVLETLAPSKVNSDIAKPSSDNIPQPKNNNKDSTIAYGFENSIKASSTPLFSRGNLSSSVSLFPTNSASNHKITSEPTSSHNSVSIIPTVTSVPSVPKTDTTPKPISTPFTQPVTISPVNMADKSADRIPLESPNQNKSATSPRPGPGNGIKRLGRPPKKGTHIATNSLGSSFSAASEDRLEAPDSKRLRTEEKSDVNDEKNDTNDLHRLMMFGATLNPTSGMAKEMTSVLQSEVESHSVYNSDSVELTGVPLPGRRREGGWRAAPHTVAGMLDPARQPQTMEELLERHWEQGSRFLMEQASHFDIASLLSSLHQLKEENVGLEDSVDRLLSRRDHLLAVRSRLMALNSLNLASHASESRREPVQNGPSSSNSNANMTDKRLVSPSSRVHISPGIEKMLPSPRDRPPPPAPSPRDRVALPSPRERDRSPRLTHQPIENGLDAMYRGQSQLLTVAHSSNSQHRQHSPSGPPKPAHYPHNASLPVHPRHPELRGHFPSSYQMVSPPAPPKGIVPMPSGPMPAHSVHTSHRSTPPRPHHHPPLPHHSIHPNLQQFMRVSPQSQLHQGKK